ncbi:MAG: hypothetical protein WCF12_09595 [Propionicimonas sp.]
MRTFAPLSDGDPPVPGELLDALDFDTTLATLGEPTQATWDPRQNYRI